MPDIRGQVAERDFNPLALQVGHVIIQLGCQREQGAAAGTAVHDLP